MAAISERPATPASRRIGRFLRDFFVDQNSLSGSIQIIELARFQGPKKACESQQAKEQCSGDKKYQHAHDRIQLRRRALSVTSSEEDDMATAAIRGVTRPHTASGTAARL